MVDSSHNRVYCTLDRWKPIVIKHHSSVGETRVVGGRLTGEKLGVIVIGIDEEEPGVITSSCGGEHWINITAILPWINLDLNNCMNTKCTVCNGAVFRASNS